MQCLSKFPHTFWGNEGFGVGVGPSELPPPLPIWVQAVLSSTGSQALVLYLPTLLQQKLFSEGDMCILLHSQQLLAMFGVGREQRGPSVLLKAGIVDLLLRKARGKLESVTKPLLFTSKTWTCMEFSLHCLPLCTPVLVMGILRGFLRCPHCCESLLNTYWRTLGQIGLGPVNLLNSVDLKDFYVFQLF